MAVVHDGEDWLRASDRIHCLGADRFMDHFNTTMREHLFNIAETGREAKAEPDCVLNDSRRGSGAGCGKFASLGPPKGQ